MSLLCPYVLLSKNTCSSVNMSFSCSSVFFLVILSTNHLFLVKMRNFPKKYLVVRKLYVNLHRKVRIGVCGR